MSGAPVVRGELRPGAYCDSVELMRLQRALAELPGVLEAGVVMATAANRELLAAAGLDVDLAREARSDDLLLVIKAESDERASEALGRADELLRSPAGGSGESGAGDYRPRSLAAAVRALPAARWVLVSVPGRLAAALAREALELGRHVFLFSDHVPVADEVALKRLAGERGLLVMGPDCGTAAIAGVGLGFANRVRRGPVGLVGASGTGLQAIASALDALGSGVSHALGTGGRDLSAEVGGATARAALDLLARDPATRVVVLVSKPPDPGVARRLLAAAAGCGKPVVVHFLGHPPPARRLGRLWFAAGLEDAAGLAAGDSMDEEKDQEKKPGKEGGGEERGEGSPPQPSGGDSAAPGGSRSGAAGGPPDLDSASAQPVERLASEGSERRSESSADRHAGETDSATGALPLASAPPPPGSVARSRPRVDHQLATGSPGSGGWLRGLFAGGTLAGEARRALAAVLGPVASALPGAPSATTAGTAPSGPPSAIPAQPASPTPSPSPPPPPASSSSSSPSLPSSSLLSPPPTAPSPAPSGGPAASRPAPGGHAVVDLGDDAYTSGRPHPMIDQELRLRLLAEQAADPEVAMVLLDLVLGDGAHPDPASELAPAVARALAAAAGAGRFLEVVVAVVGTESDPQDLAAQEAALTAAGARVFRGLAPAVEHCALALLAGASGAPAPATTASAVPPGSTAPRTPTDASAPGFATSGPEPAPVPLDALEGPPAAINVGLELFHRALTAQDTPSIHLDWRPPAGGDQRLAGILARLR